MVSSVSSNSVDSPDSKKRASLAVFSPGVVEDVESPIRKKAQSIIIIPSTMQPSPGLLKKPCDSHYADHLLLKMKPKDYKKFNRKAAHSIAPSSAEKQASAVVRNADRVSKCRKVLEITGVGEESLTFQDGPDVTITVQKGDVITVKDGDKERTFGIHRNGAKKSLFPARGTGIVRAARGDTPSPADLIPIIQNYRASPTGNPVEYLKQEIQNLTKTDPSSSS